jgi:glycosyltransferase involved in cell wall biosynthesis
MRRLVFISNMAAPYQVKFCQALREYYDAQFWYHVRLEANRPAWWRMPLGPHNRILEHVVLTRSQHYFSFDIVSELERYDPDVVLLGGLTLLSNAVAYLWAKSRCKPVLAFTELRRTPQGEPRGVDAIAVLLRTFYSGLDCILTSSEEAAVQFRNDYRFPHVVAANYPADIDGYFHHLARPRGARRDILFPNRLVDLYDPLLALAVFAEVHRRHAEARMKMNASGPLRQACQERIAALGLSECVAFLDKIASWDALPQVYDAADIMMLPARFSVGNFTIVEGMASGMGMVLSNRIQGFGKLIEEGRNGFSRAPQVDSFVDAIEQYFAAPGLFHAHAAINRELVRRYTLAETAKRFRDVVEDVIATRMNPARTEKEFR